MTNINFQPWEAPGMEIKVGDKVKLRSVGPVMIVSLVVGDPPPWPWPKSGGVECQWLVQDELKSAVFGPGTLDLIQAAPRDPPP
jgi:uncharacterized protein YodC (DUF2158 family)